jgi:hypothetical protein
LPATEPQRATSTFHSCASAASVSASFLLGHVAMPPASFRPPASIHPVNHEPTGIPNDSLLYHTMNHSNPLPESRHATRQQHAVQYRNPMAVRHLGDLMSHFGIGVAGLLGCQVWAAWRIGGAANEYLEGGRPFHAAWVFFLMMAVNAGVWFTRRGRLSNAFLLPGAVLFLLALLPVIGLHLRDVILAMQ